MEALAFAALFLTLAAGVALAAPPATLTLVGEDGQSVSLTTAELKALPHTDAAITHEGKTYGFKGALLADVLVKVKAPLGKDMRGVALSDIVVVTAADGYTVSLALSDLEPSIRPAKVIVADAMADGAALDKDGPFRLVVDGDLKPARSERNVVKIEVRRLRPKS